MSQAVIITWEQVHMSGAPLNHWLASVTEPVRTVTFASVNQRLDGTWKVNFTPRGRGIKEPITYIGPYKTKEKAMAHVERWGLAHWRTLPLLPPHEGARWAVP